MQKRYKVLITGSSGMLGIDLSRELDTDYRVYGMDVAYIMHRTSYIVNCDITDREKTIDSISKIKPDIVVHAAAYTDVDGCELDKEKAYRVNYEGTRNIALSCKRLDIPMIYMSTDFVFDGRARQPYNETDKTNPISVYGDSKLKGEEAVRQLLTKYYILRTSWLYGKNGKNFVDTIIAKAKAESVLKVVDDQTGSPTYTKDLARAIHALLNKIFGTSYIVHRTSYGIYHVSNRGAVSWFAYAKNILKIVKSRTKVVPMTSKDLDRPAKRPAMSVLDNSKFKKFTGYKMRNWHDALKEYLS